MFATVLSEGRVEQSGQGVRGTGEVTERDRSQTTILMAMRVSGFPSPLDNL